MNQTKESKFTRGKALRIVFLVAAVIAALILLRSCQAGEDLSTLEGRQAFLLEMGWEIDPASEDLRQVRLPETLEGMLEQYNEIQLAQGYDLRDHLGESCQQFTYRVTNYPDETQTVLATLYIQGRTLIAGDVHSTALNGFLQGLKND